MGSPALHAKELYMQVTDCIQNLQQTLKPGQKHGVIFLLIIMQRMVTSSTRAIKRVCSDVDVLKQEDLSLGNLSQTDSLEWS